MGFKESRETTISTTNIYAAYRRNLRCYRMFVSDAWAEKNFRKHQSGVCHHRAPKSL